MAASSPPAGSAGWRSRRRWARPALAHAASIVDVDRTSPYTGRNTLPGFASVWETASSNESFGVPRLTARQRQISREINRLAAGAHRATDGDLCPTDSPESAKRD